MEKNSLAQLLAIYPDLLKSGAMAADQYGPPGTHLASDAVALPGDMTELMWQGLGVPRPARQAIQRSNPAFETGPQMRAGDGPMAGIGPAFWRVLSSDFIPGVMKGKSR